jgi:paraquat-inducible protein B
MPATDRPQERWSRRCAWVMLLTVVLLWASNRAVLAQAGTASPPAGPTTAAVPNGVPFIIRFDGTVRGIAPGSPVEVLGIRIGTVRSIGVEYVPDSNSFVVPVEVVLLPNLFPAPGARPQTAQETYAAADALVRRGLRAQVADTQLLGGDAIITLTIEPNAPPASLGRTGPIPELPVGRTRREVIAERLQPLIDKLANAPIDQVFADMQSSMAAIKELATGPELRDALAQLRDASAELHNTAARIGSHADATFDNLNATLRTTNRTIATASATLDTINRQLGQNSPLIGGVQNAVQQLSEAARSMRLLGEYLERDPSALIGGKSDIRR